MVERHAMSLGVAGIFMVLAAGSSKPREDPSSMNTPSAPTQVATSTSTAASAAPTQTAPARTYEPVAATKLIADYQNNEVRGDNNWKGHDVAVTGIVNDIKKGPLGGIYVIVGTGGQFETHTVHCSFPQKLAAEAAELNKGDKVTIAGRVKGMVMLSVMVDATGIAQ